MRPAKRLTNALVRMRMNPARNQARPERLYRLRQCGIETVAVGKGGVVDDPRRNAGHGGPLQAGYTRAVADDPADPERLASGRCINQRLQIAAAARNHHDDGQFSIAWVHR